MKDNDKEVSMNPYLLGILVGLVIGTLFGFILCAIVVTVNRDYYNQATPTTLEYKVDWEKSS